MQLRLAHGASSNVNEFIGVDNLKLWADVAAPISMASTVLDLEADTILNIGGSSSASFFDLVLAPGVTGSRILRITGSDWAGVSGLASFFDVFAPNNAGIVQIGTDGATYVDLRVPEPATMALLALGGVALLRRRRK
jgi:hypothetical protein